MKIFFLCLCTCPLFYSLHGNTSQDSSIMEKAFHFNNCFAGILANAFCLPLFSSLPFPLSSFKMTANWAFSLGRSWDQALQFRLCLEKEQRLDSLILNSLQVHIQQDIIVLWPWKVEIFWENEFLIYDINNVTPQSVWEYFIIHWVCTCLFFILSQPRVRAHY